jgi:hypothetical protein
MREYGSISPQFWIGHSGKRLRGNLDAQVLALYLMTSPHANMIGVYYCPMVYMANDTGMTIEGASKALQRLIEVGLVEYDEGSETVFVLRMAAFQVGEDLKSNDNRVLGIKRAYQNIAATRIKSRFYEIYSAAYYLDSDEKVKPLKSPLQDPPKQLTGTGARALTGAGGSAREPEPPEPTPPQQAADAAPPPIPSDFLEVLKTRPELEAGVVWPNFCERYPPESRTLARWRKWVQNEFLPAKNNVHAITTPSASARDPTLVRLDAERALVKPMPENIRAMFAEKFGVRAKTG